MTRRPRFELRIGELVLDGITPGDRRVLVASLEGELGRLLAGDAAPFAHAAPDRARRRIAVERVDGGVTVAPGGSPHALGVAAAQTIVRQLGTLSGAPRPRGKRS